MDYQEALDYIWGQAKGLVNLEKSVAPSRAPYTLERMRALMSALDDPQDALRVVHVGGTKGKGSTAAMIDAVLRAAGFRTGFYSSPHLVDARERIRLDGEMIPVDTFTRLVNRLHPLFDAHEGTTTFEALTCMMFLWYAEQEVDVAVLEVGLGGRLDATNLVTPLVSVITPLALEHTAVLGDTIEEIAFEKAGIIKAGVPAVSAIQPASALAVLEQAAQERGAPLTVVESQGRLTSISTSLEGQRFDMQAAGADYRDLHLNLLGRHQQRNALLAVSALEAIHSALPWSESDLRRGLATVEWPARVEVLTRRPYLIVDGAHTAESAEALVATLVEAFDGTLPPSTLILGVSADKNVARLLPAFGPLARRVIFTQSEHPRAMPVEELAAISGEVAQATVVASVGGAVDAALRLAGKDELIVAAGSLFVAAEARAHAIRLGMTGAGER